jgi:leucyl aminopeptidase
MNTLLPVAPATPTTPIHLIDATDAEKHMAQLPAAARTYLKSISFEPKPGRHALAPDGGNGFVVVLGLDGDGVRHPDRFVLGKVSGQLPEGAYHLVADGLSVERRREAALAFALGAYRFAEFKSEKPKPRQLVVPGGVDGAALMRLVDAVNMGRDLINRPANSLGPAELADAIKAVGHTFGASVREIVGDDLLRENFPMIHAVGRASVKPPRLVDLTWGDPAHPKVTLVGKGVCFDTGGLNIKPDASMLLMKKDMGGAASAIVAAAILMGAGTPVRLRLLVPAVENSISGDAFRPGDILPSRKGISVEIGNTDAEGRLILADALALADEEAPAMMFDFATLTGAARVALGPDLPPAYTDDEDLAAAIAKHAGAVNDPVWRMPLWSPYDTMLDSKVADVNHIGGSFAGSITAALFLRRFVTQTRAWAHFDVYNWNSSLKSGRPEGGDIQAARLVADLVMTRFG